MYYPDGHVKLYLHPLISPISCKYFGRLIVFAITVADNYRQLLLKIVLFCL